MRRRNDYDPVEIHVSLDDAWLEPEMSALTTVWLMDKFKISDDYVTSMLHNIDDNTFFREYGIFSSGPRQSSGVILDRVIPNPAPSIVPSMSYGDWVDTYWTTNNEEE